MNTDRNGHVGLTRQALVAAALADGDSRLTNVPPPASVEELLDALRELGAAVRHDAARGCVDVAGCGGCWPNDEADLLFQRDQQAAHLISAACCLGRGQYRIEIASEARHEPAGPLVDALIDLGATIGYAGDSGDFPVTIRAAGLHGGMTTLRTSVWPLAPLLMAAPYCRSDVFIEVTATAECPAEIAETLAIMEAFGVQVIHDRAARFIVPAPQRYRAIEHAAS